MQQPPMPPNVQQTPDGTSYDTAASAAPADPGLCTKVEIVPQAGGGAPGQGGFTVTCSFGSGGQPQSSVASTPDQLIQIVGQALGLAPPPSDATAESATAPASAPAPTSAGGY